ncbi:MAG TPA: hypothetical protein VFD73_22670, partial [Gemmatimonadales bacterium]|nr:hypothetical protein [Gemmatimonadales bacterium]
MLPPADYGKYPALTTGNPIDVVLRWLRYDLFDAERVAQETTAGISTVCPVLVHHRIVVSSKQALAELSAPLAAHGLGLESVIGGTRGRP